MSADLTPKELAAVMKRASGDGVLEKPFREAVEAHLIGVASAAEIDLVPRTEVTLGSSGRADTIYNRFIVPQQLYFRWEAVQRSFWVILVAWQNLGEPTYGSRPRQSRQRVREIAIRIAP